MKKKVIFDIDKETLKELGLTDAQAAGLIDFVRKSILEKVKSV